MATEAASPRGIDTVVTWLRQRPVDFDVVDHRETMSSAQEARAAGFEPDHVAKTVVLRDGDQYRIVAIPASHRLDLRKAREAFEGSSHLRLATEVEMEADFEQFEVGALPPIGPMVRAPEIVDRHLMGRERILCTGGDHRHSLLISPEELARIADARVTDVCED
jgi:Ala-tRNA(Pro) deacylase